MIFQLIIFVGILSQQIRNKTNSSPYYINLLIKKKITMFLVDQLQRRNISNNKMDTMFYNSIGRAKSSYWKKFALHIFKLILLVAFLIVDTQVLNTDRWRLVILMKLGIATSVINAIITFLITTVGYRDSQGNNKFFLYLSEVTGHSTREPLNSLQSLNRLDQCVSSVIYNAGSGATNTDAALTSEIRQKYEKIYKNLVQGQVMQRHKCSTCLDLLGRILSLATVIYGIVVLITSGPSLPEVAVLGLYLALESINIWMIILIILFLIFSPVICCVGCLYLLCTGGSAFIDRESLSIPEPTPANARVIEQSDGTCTICLQNFSLNEKLITLQCSPKHTFHDKCILSWLRVSNSCPICRKPVPQSI